MVAAETQGLRWCGLWVEKKILFVLCFFFLFFLAVCCLKCFLRESYALTSPPTPNPSVWRAEQPVGAACVSVTNTHPCAHPCPPAETCRTFGVRRSRVGRWFRALEAIADSMPHLYMHELYLLGTFNQVHLFQLLLTTVRWGGGSKAECFPSN